jgi:hypothetical protein
LQNLLALALDSKRWMRVTPSQCSTRPVRHRPAPAVERTMKIDEDIGVDDEGDAPGSGCSAIGGHNRMHAILGTGDASGPPL